MHAEAQNVSARTGATPELAESAGRTTGRIGCIAKTTKHSTCFHAPPRPPAAQPPSCGVRGRVRPGGEGQRDESTISHGCPAARPRHSMARWDSRTMLGTACTRCRPPPYPCQASTAIFALCCWTFSDSDTGCSFDFGDCEKPGSGHGRGTGTAAFAVLRQGGLPPADARPARPVPPLGRVINCAQCVHALRFRLTFSG